MENDLYSKRKVQVVRETLPLSHQVRNGRLCFLNSFSERSIGVA